MYKNILVPHAGTASGDEALKHAVFIAESSSAKIVLFNVVEQIQIPPTFSLSSSERESLINQIQQANNELKEDMEKQMHNKLHQYESKKIKADTKVVIGDAAEEILRFVEEQKVDLIVMSKRRKLKGVRKLLTLGSVSRKIVETVNCPVLLLDVEKL